MVIMTSVPRAACSIICPGFPRNSFAVISTGRLLEAECVHEYPHNTTRINIESRERLLCILAKQKCDLRYASMKYSSSRSCSRPARGNRPRQKNRFSYPVLTMRATHAK
jgi:hypothetical protein